MCMYNYLSPYGSCCLVQRGHLSQIPSHMMFATHLFQPQGRRRTVCRSWCWSRCTWRTCRWRMWKEGRGGEEQTRMTAASAWRPAWSWGRGERRWSRGAWAGCGGGPSWGSGTEDPRGEGYRSWPILVGSSATAGDCRAWSAEGRRNWKEWCLGD